MARDPEKLKIYRKRHQDKLKKFGVNRIGIIKKCNKCKLEFSQTDIIHTVKGARRKYYHKKCWKMMQY